MSIMHPGLLLVLASIKLSGLFVEATGLVAWGKIPPAVIRGAAAWVEVRPRVWGRRGGGRVAHRIRVTRLWTTIWVQFLLGMIWCFRDSPQGGATTADRGKD